MGSGIKTGVMALLAAALVGCALIPLDDNPQYAKRTIARGNPHDRTKYRLNGMSPEYVTVKKGDTVYLLSRAHEVPIRAMIETNNLSAPFLLTPGQRLKLPKPAVHVVRKGDTIYSISRRYNVDMSLLARHNKIKAPYAIYEGQFLRMPGTIVSETPAQQTVWLNPTKKTPAKTVKKSSVKTPAKKTKPASRKKAVRLPAPPSRSQGKFAWPVLGRVMTKFGSAGAGRHNDGINISAQEGVSVRAAENGVVAYAGNELKGFGNLLLIKHSDGWITAYAHNREILVARGQTVKRGQPVAKVGKTGSAKEPQLHFEIRKGTKAVDPLAYMEKR